MNNKRTKKINRKSNKTNKTKTVKQSGGFIFGSSKKRKREAFNLSMNNFCKVTRDGNNIPKGQKVTRNLVHEVCANFYELEDNTGFLGGIFNFAVGVAKKPFQLAKSAYQKISTSTESISSSGDKKRVQPLEN